jgi:hypothetical protein
MELLDKCRCQRLRNGNAAIANFHHPSSRNLPHSILSQTCSCDVYCGSHSDKGHRNKAAISEVEVCPPVRAARLASLSAFQFSQTIVVSPFWCLQQCITATHLGAQTASSSSRISYPYLIHFPPELMSPLFLYKAP